MARRKRNSSVLERAERRIESLRSINPGLNLGSELTIEIFADTIDNLRSKLAAYNTALSSIDKLADDVRNAEKAAMTISEKMLLGVGSRYGKMSQEYEMAGGSRRKSSRRAVFDPKPAEAAQTVTSTTNGASVGAS